MCLGNSLTLSKHSSVTSPSKFLITLMNESPKINEILESGFKNASHSN